MTEYSRQIGGEYRAATFTFNLNKLAVYVDHLGDFRPFTQIGSDKNQLQIHLILYLAFHRCFITRNCPVPGFLILDQVDRPFYPDDSNYENNSDPEKLMSDPDRQALLEIFDLFYEICSSLGGNLQIIVLQHANFPDNQYQAHIIENWRNGKGLVPSEWIDDFG
jgi:hypothetical protein